MVFGQINGDKKCIIRVIYGETAFSSMKKRGTLSTVIGHRGSGNVIWSKRKSEWIQK